MMAGGLEMQKVKHRPSGLKYTGTKYGELYVKLRNFVTSKVDLPTEDVFYNKAAEYCKSLKFDNLYNAICAVRKNVTASKDFVLKVTDMGDKFIDIK